MEHKHSTAPLNLSKWRNVPMILLLVGGVFVLAGVISLVVKPGAMFSRQFLFSYLLAFMFGLSICLGALFLVLAHHLFDAGWSVPIRRFCEHISSMLFPCMALLFLPIGFGAKVLFAWMRESHPQSDHALQAKFPLFTVPGFWISAAFCFAVWWLLTNRLRYWSIKQDEDGAALPTYRMRFYSGIGIVLYAMTLTLGAVMWMKGLQWQWFSTMYGVYYFAGSVWLMLATAYVITM